MPSLFDISQNVILLTGGAGLYGRGLAATLAETGCKLVLASRNVDALQKVADEENKNGHQVTALPLDQGEPESIQKLLAAILERFGRIDGLVNNAVSRPMKDLNDPVEAWAESMRINATGLFAITRAFADQMAEQGGGSIVNIGSIQGMVGVEPNLYKGTELSTTPSPDYYFHKGGMLNFTRYFASAYGDRGVRVNTLSPGGFYNNQPEAFLERYENKTMLGRMADSTDLGGPVVFLLSDAAKYVTAANLAVDGGYTAK
jgi:NAD(P)-dependent dehydrogenase (short-subunit alcohol dehydrogenase family)